MAGAPRYTPAIIHPDQMNRVPARPAASTAPPAAAGAPFVSQASAGSGTQSLGAVPRVTTGFEGRDFEGNLFWRRGGRHSKKSRRPRRKTSRRRGGARTAADWLNELHYEPTEETLLRVVAEIQASGDRNLILIANFSANLLRFRLGPRETREGRIAEAIRRLREALLEHAPGWRPSAVNPVNARAIGKIQRLSKAGLPLPDDLNRQVVGFLSPGAREEDPAVELSRIAVATGRPGVRGASGAPAPPAPPAPPPGGAGPAAAGAGGPAGGRRRSTRRRGGAMVKSMRELQRDLEADPSKSTLDNVLTDLKASDVDELAIWAEMVEENLRQPLRAGETMESRVRDTVERAVGMLRMVGRGRRRKTTRRHK